MISEAATVEKLNYVNFVMHGFVPSSHTRPNKGLIEYDTNSLRKRNWQSPASNTTRVNLKSTRPNEEKEQICISPGMSPNPQEKDEMKWNSDSNTCSEDESRCYPKSDGYTSSLTDVSVINDGNSPGYVTPKTYMEHDMGCDINNYNINIKRSNNIHRPIQLKTMPATYTPVQKTYNKNVSTVGKLSNAFSNRYCASNPPYLGSQHWITIVIIPQNPVPENVKEINAGLCWDFN